MGIKLPDNAKILMAGLPFHGLWKDGAITLPNDETKTCPAPVNGACVLLKVPGQPAVTRSEAEAAADEAAGLEWRNYGLISGGRFGGSNALYTSNAATILYIDATKKRWLVKIVKDNYTDGGFFLSVVRFGHIDGTTQGWSSSVYFSISFPVGFNPNSISSLFTHAQNSNGSESVFGSLTLLVKITLSGDVDPEASDLGLSISTELIEYYGRLCINRTVTTTVNGEFTETSDFHWIQTDNSTALPTGVTYDQHVVWVDGTMTENNGQPTPVSGYSWSISTTDIAFFSDKVKTVVINNSGTKYIGAGYSGDALKLIGHTYEYVKTETTTWSPNYDPYKWIYKNVSGQFGIDLIAKIGAGVINDQGTVSDPSSIGSGPLGPERVIVPLPANMLDGYADMQTGSSLKWEDYSGAQGPLTPWEDITVSGVDYKRSVYLTHLSESSLGWKNPVVALITQTRPVGYGPDYDVYTTTSVHAPSLTNQTTSVSIASLRASWQPVTDQLAVDTETICWF